MEVYRRTKQVTVGVDISLSIDESRILVGVLKDIDPSEIGIYTRNQISSLIGKIEHQLAIK